LMLVTSHWTQPRMRSPHRSAIFSAHPAKADSSGQRTPQATSAFQTEPDLPRFVNQYKRSFGGIVATSFESGCRWTGL
jgi:hypothetical protein